MSLNTGFQQALDIILAACRRSEVAEVAKVSTAEWSAHHVFYGAGNYIRGRNRGRAPYVEVSYNTGTFEETSQNNQQELFTFRIRVFTRGINEAANRSAQSILRSLLRYVKEEDDNINLQVSISAPGYSPWGMVLEASLTGDLHQGQYGFMDGE